MSATHYIRVEGVNMDPFILDTQDLSTIRGGGLLLLEAIQDLCDKYNGQSRPYLEPISTGASAGLFRFTGDTDAAKTLVEEIREWLNGHAYFQHATILVDSVPASAEGFVADRERLMARIRRRQLASPGLAVPTLVDAGTNGDTPAVCQIDGIRPAQGKPRKIKGEQRVLSRATEVRRGHGVDQKGIDERRVNFYQNLLRRDLEGQGNNGADQDKPPLSERINDERFARHFQDIAGSASFGPLNDKMAVLYLDGNGFTGIQRKQISAAIKTAIKKGQDKDQAAIKAQKDFDAEVKRTRAEFLKWLLEEAVEEANKRRWRVSPHDARQAKEQDEDEDERAPTGRLRLETLMWGGDEFMLVLPAWEGWAVAHQFLTQSAKWKIGNDPLHHALGLVFCGYKAPIHRVVALARELADLAKEDGMRGRKCSSLAYQVLESFDHLGNGAEDHLTALTLPGAETRHLILDVDGVEALSKHLPGLKAPDGLPQRQLKRMVRACFIARDLAQAGQTWKDLEFDGKATLEGLLHTLSDKAKTGSAAWFQGLYHLDQLWAYVAPEAEAEQASTQGDAA
ncbi:hypothetical protein [Roseospirillum parvum]|uniref:Uncharacterized protein n=1 Tax=Roseospirillum parvum TaxID=83401 RepID=A0A1G8FC30_9PROT|nr:hypothetical protein [Roseospirillum parvum]SDH79711.1 hypothetical protein SAMN05421742_11326 [Roseospirillum parvum]